MNHAGADNVNGLSGLAGKRAARDEVEIFSTCPESSRVAPEIYRQQLIEVARWSDAAGCRGILVYSDNSLLDPWLLSQIIIENTNVLCPLVAVQPIYMHPFTVAKMVATFAQLYRRRIYLNMIAGGFKNDLAALNDSTPHDERYDRLVEYTLIIKRLLLGETVTFEGKFYRVDKLKLSPPLPPDLFPGIFISGSSEAGMAAARAIGCTAIKYPRPTHEEESVLACGIDCGIRVGVIARAREDDAWAFAYGEFPEDRKGQLTRQLAAKVSDSLWHRQLAELEKVSDRTAYWLVPFQNYKTMCPYLVGSYDTVAAEIARYLASGYTTFILDIPRGAQELSHSRIAFDRALRPLA
ncbi:MAG TPA: LLM class flavin-dependent oxidoreductase [Candidatus Binatia bacterium]